MRRKPAKTERKMPCRAKRLGFRLDQETKDLIERAAHLSRCKVSDFCVTALTDTARRTIAEHETLVLSDRDRAAFFDALVNPPEPSERLVRAPGRAQAPGRFLSMATPRAPISTFASCRSALIPRTPSGDAG